jgi:hypothetical protein
VTKRPQEFIYSSISGIFCNYCAHDSANGSSSDFLIALYFFIMLALFFCGFLTLSCLAVTVIGRTFAVFPFIPVPLMLFFFVFQLK